MRWILAILVLTFAVLACNLGGLSQSQTDPVLSPSVTVIAVTESSLPTLAPSIASPVPTGTITPTLPPAASDSESRPVPDENRIEFPTGGTWMEVGAHLQEGGSIRYVLSALQGQVMSVSVRQSRPFSVEVTDSDGSLIAPNYEQPFWRGALPVTGDYFITVKTQATGDFILRVAINPPGQAYQYFEYENPERSVMLRYSDEFAPTTYTPVGDFKGSPSLVLQFIRPDFYNPVTNLGEAYFLYSEADDAQTVDTCTKPLPQLETVTGQERINGYNFTRSEVVGAAAGNIYDQVIYRTVYNSVCSEIVFFMHSGNIGNYTPGTVVEFDRLALLQKFEQILSTFSVQ